MKNILRVLITVMIVSGCNSDNSTVLRDPMFDDHASQRSALLSEKDQQSSKVEVAFLGDSHFEFMDTDSYPFRSINLGIRGDTVYAITLRAEQYQTLKTADVIALSLGTNNVANGVSTKATVQQIKELVEQFPEQKFAIGLLNPLSEESGFKNFNQSLFKINERLQTEFGSHGRVLLVDSMAPESKTQFKLSRDHYGPDGIHFSEYGYDRWNALWLAAFETLLES